MTALPYRSVQRRQARIKQKRSSSQRVRSPTFIVLLLLVAASAPCCGNGGHADAIELDEQEIIEPLDLQQLEQSKQRFMIQEALDNTESPTVANPFPKDRRPTTQPRSWS